MRQRVVRSDVDDVGAAAEGSGLSLSARRALKRVDVYPKMHREFKVQTEFGGTGASSSLCRLLSRSLLSLSPAHVPITAVSVVAGVVMLVLFLSEFRAFLSLNTHEHMVVDASLNEKLQINVDMSFLAISCKGAWTSSHRAVVCVRSNHSSHECPP